MAKYLFIAQCDCLDPDQEKEVIDWLDKIHIPDVLATPGIVRAECYENINSEDNKRPKFVAMYEIETENIKEFQAELNQTLGKIVSSGRLLKSAAPERAYPFSTPFYQRIKSFEKPSKK
jgi:hypothetical protein